MKALLNILPPRYGSSWQRIAICDVRYTFSRDSDLFEVAIVQVTLRIVFVCQSMRNNYVIRSTGYGENGLVS